MGLQHLAITKNKAALRLKRKPDGQAAARRGWLREASTQHKHTREVECIVRKHATDGVLHNVRHCGVESRLFAGVGLVTCSDIGGDGFQNFTTQVVQFSAPPSLATSL